MGQLPQTLKKKVQQQPLASLLVRCLYVHLRLQDGHQALGQDTPGDVELLLHNGLDALLVEVLDHRSLLGAEDASGHAAIQQVVQRRHVLHQLHSILLLGQTLVDLQEGHHPLVLPEVCRRRKAADLTVDGPLKEDRSHDTGTVELLVLDYATAHLVHLIHHLHLSRVREMTHAVASQGLRRAATTHVEGQKETCLLLDLDQLHLLPTEGTGGFEDGLARLIYGLREVLLALSDKHALCESSAEARDHARVLREKLARLLTGVTARER
mmetsp:Transcript_25608/g.65313  ORF Transcript_25608/g.65313 Transcript_25608/m.65313 type:complete len:268 (-) Transcript_25608:143-946(-)